MSEYKIPTHIGTTDDLTFRIAPVNKAIISADADWAYDAELCLDNTAASALLRPFLDPYLKKPFEARDEINTLPFSRVRLLIEDLRQTSALLLDHYDEPALKEFKSYIPLDVILPPEERERASLASRAEKERLLKEHIKVVTDFYEVVIDHLTFLLDTYRPKGFRHIAITSPV